jgi:hypothetical protein
MYPKIGLKDQGKLDRPPNIYIVSDDIFKVLFK